MKRRAAGAIAFTAILVITYVTFAGVPLNSSFELRGNFKTGHQLTKGSPVRIAGLEIGRVAGVEAGPRGTAIVKMDIDKRDTPIRNDAQLAIKPKLALEGSYYVDVRPGTPGAPELRSGDTIPLGQTEDLVQLDQVLDVFDAPIRAALQRAAGELATGLGGTPGMSGSAGLRQATAEIDQSLVGVGQAARALTGTKPGDLRRGLATAGDFTAQITRSPAVLADLVTNFDRTMAAMSAHDAALSQTLRNLDGLLRVAPDRLRRIDAPLPTLTRFARTLQPTLAEAPVTLKKANRMLAQIQVAVADPQVPRLLRRVEPVTAALPTLNRRLATMLPWLTEVADCLSQKIVPTMSTPIKDGPNTTGQKPWEELLHFGANIASGAAGHDGNGTVVRMGTNYSEKALHATVPGLGDVFASGDIAGVSPTWLGYGVDPPFRPDERCRDQALPNLQARSKVGRPSEWTVVDRPEGGQEAAGMQRLRASLLDGDPRGALKALRGLPALKALWGRDR